MDHGTPPPAGASARPRSRPHKTGFTGLPVALLGAASLMAPSAVASPLFLRDGWAIQSSARVPAKGDAVSRPGFSTEGWHSITVPNTVVGALVESGQFKDPFFGTNLRSIPGTTYPIGQRFTLLPMPEDSP